MVNQIVLVGRIARTPETKTSENGKKFATLTLAVPRNYKNANGEYDRVPFNIDIAIVDDFGF